MRFLKAARIALLVLFFSIVGITILFLVDRYIFNPNLKGISLVDLKDILIYHLLPLGIIIGIIWQVEKRFKKE